eukprot:3071125-Prymnesium_polylepis.1
MGRIKCCFVAHSESWHGRAGRRGRRQHATSRARPATCRHGLELDLAQMGNSTKGVVVVAPLARRRHAHTAVCAARARPAPSSVVVLEPVGEAPRRRAAREEREAAESERPALLPAVLGHAVLRRAHVRVDVVEHGVVEGGGVHSH